MKIIHLVPDLSNYAGGLINSIPPFIAEQVKLNHEVYILGSASSQYDSKPWVGKVSKLEGNFFKKIYSIFKRLKKIQPDFIEIHGLWDLNHIGLLFFLSVTKSDVKICVTPRGMLTKWALMQSKFKKRIAFFLYQKALLKRANILRFLNKNEMNNSTTAENFTKSIIIENGIEQETKFLKKEFNEINLLYMSRIHLKKGIFEFLEALLKLSKEKDHDKKLNVEICGWGSNKDLTLLKNKISKVQSNQVKINFNGPVFGEKKEEIFNNSNVLILPSYDEGLPMCVLEAWKNGLVTMISPGCNFDESFKNGAALEVQPCPENIHESLKNLLVMDQKELTNLSENGNRFLDKYLVKNLNSKFFELMGFEK